MRASERQVALLTSGQILDALTATSVLCLPIGSHEQHGPHLPLATDTMIAQGFTDRLIASYGDSHDLWSLPAIPYGLSPEHAWAPGSITLPPKLLLDLLDATCSEYARATPARCLMIVNGHGGNRGLLDIAVHELTRRHHMNVCVIHPSSLSTVGSTGETPEIHAGSRETSIMLALFPHHVRLDLIPSDGAGSPGQDTAIARLVLARGTSWPWNSNDPALGRSGVIGNHPHQASAQLGEQVLSDALDRCPDIIDSLLQGRGATESSRPRRFAHP